MVRNGALRGSGQLTANGLALIPRHNPKSLAPNPSNLSTQPIHFKAYLRLLTSLGHGRLTRRVKESGVPLR